MGQTELCVVYVRSGVEKVSQRQLLQRMRNQTLSQSPLGALKAPFAPSQDISQGPVHNLKFLWDSNLPYARLTVSLICRFTHRKLSSHWYMDRP